MMAVLFDVNVRIINVHLKNIYNSGELIRDATIRKFLIVQTEGNREVSRNIEHYNLYAIISIGYRVNSVRATQFRQYLNFTPKPLSVTISRFFLFGVSGLQPDCSGS